MTTTYCTADRVFKDFLLRTDYTSKLTQAKVEQIINSAEDYIDMRTNYSWRLNNEHEFKTGILINDNNTKKLKIHLSHRNIYSFDLADYLKYWDGGNWIDITSNNNMYRLLEEDGIIYLDFDEVYEKGVEIKYRWGDGDGIPADITHACILLSAAEIMSIQDAQVIMEAGQQTDLNNQQKVDLWRAEAEEILKLHTKFAPVS